jgi:serine/threonine-protein kinase
MPESDARSARVLALAEEFVQRHRRGENPSVEEYVDQYPELADGIREVFPAMAMMEDVAEADASILSGSRPGSLGGHAPSAPGRLGDFRIIREVGRGGMGVVYEAEQISLGRHVALKVLPHQGAAGSTKLRRFLFEAKAAARLHHSNIVPVYGVGDQDGVHYYAMQFINGQGLDVVFAELRAEAEGSATMTLSVTASLMATGSFRLDRDTSGTAVSEVMSGEDVAQSKSSADFAEEAPAVAAIVVPPTPSPQATGQRTAYFRAAARVGRDVAEALAYAHGQGILHRDIKPSNLLLDVDGNVWITDFGLATGEGAGGLTETGDVVGTLRYMAPERFDGWSDPRSDVYSLGATLYELLTLRPLFDDSNRARLMKMVAHQAPVPPRRVDPSIPLDLETIVLKAIAKEPSHRYDSAEQMAEDLRRYLEGRPILARRIGPLERLSRWSRRNPTVAASLAAVFLTLSLAIVGMALLWRRAEGQRRRADDLLELSELRLRDAEMHRAADDRNRADAEAQFARARSAVDELLTRVSESQLRDVLGLQPLRRDLLRSALSYYEDFVRQRSHDPSLRAGLAAAQLQLAIIQRELGAEDQSEESLRHALASHESALLDRPGDPRLRAGMALCCANLSLLGLDPVHPRISPDQALPLLERAIGLWEGLTGDEPGNVDHLGELANAYNLVGVLQSHRGRMPESLRAQQASIALREKLAAAHPEDPSFQNDLASSLNNLGALVERAGIEGVDQLRILQRAAAHGRVADSRAPQVTRYGRSLTTTLRNIAVAERARGHHDEAERAFREALEVSRRLVRDNLAVPVLRAELVQDYRSLGDVLRERGRVAAAVRLYRESWGSAQSISRTKADDWYAAAGLLGLCARPAVDPGTTPDEQERAECRRFGDAAMAALRRAIAAGFKNAEVIRAGDEYAALRGRDDFPAVLALLERAAHGQAPPAELARTPFPPSSVAAAPIGRAADHPKGHGAGDHRGGGAGGDVGRVPLEEDQASSQHALGLVLVELGRFDEARATLGRALAARTNLVNSHPAEACHRADLGATRAAIGRLDWRAGRLAEAVKTWDEVRRGFESDLHAHPGQAAIAEQLAALEVTVGQSYADAALWDEALDALGRAVRHGSRDRSVALSRASLLAVVGDRDGLKALCKRLLEDYGATTEELFANRLALGCVLVPGCVPDPGRLVGLAEEAVAAGHRDPRRRFHLALAAYRAGRFDEAVRQATASLAGVTAGEAGLVGPLDQAVLAMAHHRLGQPEAAARQIDALSRLDWEAIERATEPQDWWQRADFLALQREAIATVTGRPAPDDPKLRERRGRAYAQLGQSAKAEAEFRAAGAAASRTLSRSN